MPKGRMHRSSIQSRSLPSNHCEQQLQPVCPSLSEPCAVLQIKPAEEEKDTHRRNGLRCLLVRFENAGCQLKSQTGQSQQGPLLTLSSPFTVYCSRRTYLSHSPVSSKEALLSIPRGYFILGWDLTHKRGWVQAF